MFTPSSKASSGSLMTVPFPKVQNVRFINNSTFHPLGKSRAGESVKTLRAFTYHSSLKLSCEENKCDVKYLIHGFVIVDNKVHSS